MKNTPFFRRLLPLLFLYLFSVGPVHSQKLDSITLYMGIATVFSDYNVSEKNGYNFDIGIGFPIKSWLSINTGFNVAKYGTHHNFIPIQTQGTNLELNPPIAFEVTAFDYHYLSFPLRARFSYGAFYAQVGIKPEFFLYQLPQDKGVLYDAAYVDQPFHEPDMVRKRNVSVDGGLGVAFFPKKIPIRYYLEGSTSYFLQPIHQDGRAEYTQASLILKLGLRWLIVRG